MLALTAADAWSEAVRQDPDSRFLFFEGREWTYREFDQWSANLADSLTAFGFGYLTHVAVVAENSAEYLRLLLALTRLGAVSVPINFSGSDDDIRYVIEHSEAEWVIADPARIDLVVQLTDEAAVRAAALTSDGVEPVGAGSTTAVAPADAGGVTSAGAPTGLVIGPDDPWSIIYTSGSTGRPRGVIIPQRAFGACGRAIARHFSYRSDDTVMCVLPLYHLSATVMGWAAAVDVRGSFALANKFSRSGFWPFVDRSGATVTITVPTVVEMLAASAPRADDRGHRLRLLVTHRPYPDFAARFGVRTASLWAMTETSGMGLATEPGTHGRDVDVIGKRYPPDATVELLDETGTPVGRGQIGEIWFSHPAAMLGYYGETAERYGIPGRPVRSGDLARLDDKGIFHYVGRLKNMIKRGGENISGEEIERLIIQHPDVAEVLVLAVSDPIYVEEVCAVVVSIDPSAAVSTCLAVTAWCESRLPAWKVPRYYVARETPLPKLGNEKVDRRRMQVDIGDSNVIDRLGPRTKQSY